MDITLVYFIYGLAFFSMGLAMLMESNRSPLLAQSRVLRPLAFFGFVHGFHEWFEMFLDKSQWLVFQDPVLVGWFRIGILSLSFISLGIFSFRVLRPQPKLSNPHRVILLGGVSLYTIVVIAIAGYMWSHHLDRLGHVDAMIRYLVAIPSAFLAGVAFYQQANQARDQGRMEIGNLLFLTAIGFTGYAITQAIVPMVDVFPGNVINTQSFVNFFGFPVQMVRAVLAGLVTVSLIRATQLVDRERQRQFLDAQQGRLDALEKVQEELLHREAMREELLRHTVIAQEDERARIARELHDEMAQILTGFTLHLATLCESGCQYPDVKKQVDILQSLSQQMADSLYRLVHDLRPAQLDDLGLVAALQYLVDDTSRRIGLQANMVITGKQIRLDTLVETVLFRSAQEALTNIARHAKVDQADVVLSYEPGLVSLKVKDSGKGFELQDGRLPKQSWGLAGMRERVESVGGELILTSAPGKGTIVEIVIPNGKEHNNAIHSINARG
jgi:signal transduction histidine kinase